MKDRRLLSLPRRLWERLLYLINPFRSGNSYPAALRNTDLWESTWLAADPLRHRYWLLKNARHRGRAIATTERGRRLVDALFADGIAIQADFVHPALLGHMERTARSYIRLAEGVDIDTAAPGRQCHLNNMGNELAPDDPILLYLRGEELMSIASGYLGFAPRLRRLALFFNQPMPDLKGPHNVEKHFHTDSHDFRVLKLFIYLHDTAPKNGPFTYVRGTHFHGKRRGVVCRLPSYSEISAEEMAAFVPQSHWIEAVGPAGTAFFAETSGVHRGGRTQEGHRLMLVAEYSSHHPWCRLDHDIPES